MSVDVTDLWQQGFPNYYVFNPSIVNFDQDYLVCYRVCWYRLENVYHPWKIWDNGYKYFSNRAQVKSLKHRPNLDLEPIKVAFEGKMDEPPSDEYDSTGIAHCRWSEGKFHLVRNQPNAFPDQMNQDARIYKHGDEYIISYNTFESEDKCTLRYRTLHISADGEICMSPEKYLFAHNYSRVEKNCVLHRNHVIYQVARDLVLLSPSGERLVYPCPFRDLVDYYGAQNILVSSSTPALEWIPGRFLAAAHVKVCYKKIQHGPLRTFIDNVDLRRYHRHGKYFYFIALYEFDEEWKILRASQPFIPSEFSDHLPYLLCMPMGIAHMPNKEGVFLSYGEGDCRCKILPLENVRIDALLSPGPLSPECFLLGRKSYIRHFGYFGHANAGDEAYIDCFKYLRARWYPEAEICFENKGVMRAPWALTVFGGGDVINDYFTRYLEDTRVVAVSVGIPYSEFEPRIRPFQRTWLRNSQDAARLGVDYYPDLAFLLPRIYLKPLPPRCAGVIGISVLRPYYNAAHLQHYSDYIEALVDLCKRMIGAGLLPRLIPFCLGIRSQNDLITAREIADRVPGVDVFKPDKTYQVESIYRAIAGVEFMFCARFHSHIFSVIHATPFISLTCGRKCIEFVKQEGLEKHLFLLTKSELDLPLKINVDDLWSFFLERYGAREGTAVELGNARSRIFHQMEAFEAEYAEELRLSAPRTESVLFYPSFGR